MKMASHDHVFEHNTGIEQDEIDRVRELIGEPLRVLQYNHEATLDTIRHYAHGLGDDNPLWCDPGYAEKSAYGTLMAPPTFFYSIFSPGITPGFDGLQVFFGSGMWKINRLARRGEVIVPKARLVDVYEARGKRASHMVVQVGETSYETSEGEVLATYTSRALRVPRATQKDGLSYEPRPTYRYTDDEMADIEAQVLSQRGRGAEPRYWEDVNVGDDLDTLVKGPLNTATLMAYYAGNLNGAGYRACEMQWRTRHAARYHPETIPNNRSAGWLMEATWPGMGHMDASVAQAVGMPGAYDNGWMRLGWMSQVVSDWVGDDGLLSMLDVRVVLPNLIGDTLWCKGKVTGKRIDGDKHVVTIDLHAVNQLGDLSCKGSAEAILPAGGGKG
jgi:acyl dehydratase